MTYALALAAIWALGWLVLPVGLWRPLKRGNGRNWPGMFIVDPAAPHARAVWAQEFYEARRKWRGLPWAVPLMAIGRAVPRLAAWERDLELTGKEIEVQAEARLRGEDAHTEKLIRLREATSLAQHYRAFRGVPRHEILDRMRDRRDAARAFVDRHWSRIRDAAP